MHRAAQFGLPDIAAALIEANAQVDLGTNEGLTPLMMAARTGQSQALRSMRSEVELTTILFGQYDMFGYFNVFVFNGCMYMLYVHIQIVYIYIVICIVLFILYVYVPQAQLNQSCIDCEPVCDEKRQR